MFTTCNCHAKMTDYCQDQIEFLTCWNLATLVEEIETFSVKKHVPDYSFPNIALQLCYLVLHFVFSGFYQQSKQIIMCNRKIMIK